ncbi:hypothetical protein CRG98_017286 [Punica granatum]|uniref:Uncharacterized protein n=1 Tax=Punica granatum TaxID=22663 RepID=A0A2I0K146_PUNGR|nr:hypothetical protein CRG98_017286 [Punica granatum]
MCKQERGGLVPGRPSAEELRKQEPEPVWKLAVVQARCWYRTGLGAGTSVVGSGGGRGMTAKRIIDGGGTLASWLVGSCIAGASIPSGARVGET